MYKAHTLYWYFLYIWFMGIFNKILGSILKSRTETVLTALTNDPILKEIEKKRDEAIKQFDKSVTKANKVTGEKLKKAGIHRISDAFDWYKILIWNENL